MQRYVTGHASRLARRVRMNRGQCPVVMSALREKYTSVVWQEIVLISEPETGAAS